MVSLAEVDAGVRTAIASYTHALDDGRAEDVVATFCADGVVEIPGLGTHEGHEALLAAFSKWRPRQPQRHLVLNTHVTRWDDQEAEAISDVVFLLLVEGEWAVKLVGRYHDVLHLEGDRWRFHRREASWASAG